MPARTPRNASVSILFAFAACSTTMDGGAPPDAGALADAGLPDEDGAVDVRSPVMADQAARFLEECFADLRKGATHRFQDASKASADGRFRMRLALENPPDIGGTSGTVAWRVMRFGLVTPDTTICIREEVALASTYKGSHHNCKDVLTILEGGRRYVVNNPDSAFDPLALDRFERPGKLTVYAGETIVAGPIPMETVACHRTGRDDGLCNSGGPCVGPGL